MFLKNPSKRICCHERPRDHKTAVITLTTIRMDNLGNNTAKESDLSGERQKANTLHIHKLIRVVHFFARNNLPVKSLYPKMINFLSYELEEPIIKQYPDNCPSNALNTSHEICDYFINCIDKYLWEQTKERLKCLADVVLFADKASDAGRKEMLGIFISSLDEKNRNSI